MGQDDVPETTADQDAWVEIAHALREQVRKRIPDIAAMNPQEIHTFIEAVREVRYLEEMAQSLDREIELRKTRGTWNG